MKLTEMPEDVREKAHRLRKKLCDAATKRAGVAEDVCAECDRPCEYGRKLLELLGMPAQQERPHTADVFERVVPGFGSRARKVIHGINKGGL